jgi:hypothetical protein
VRRRRPILLANLREDPAYALNSYNWISFGTWGFDARRRARYLGDLDYLDREIAAEEEENDVVVEIYSRLYYIIYPYKLY